MVGVQSCEKPSRDGALREGGLVGYERIQVHLVVVGDVISHGFPPGACVHVREVRAALARRGDGLEGTSEAITKLQGYMSYCAACKHLLLDSMAMFEGIVNEAVPKLGSTNLKRAHEHDPSKVKRARKDEDLVNCTVTSAASAHLSTGKLAEVEVNASRRSGHNWDERFLCKTQATAWLSFARAATLSLAADAKRLGNPAEDTICYFAVDPEHRIGTWFPPQASLVHW